MLRGWVNYFAVGNSSECFSYIRDWVEKKVRRHLAHARKRKGFGWEPYGSAMLARAKASLADSLLEEAGFEPVWGFSCQVVFWFVGGSLFGARKSFFVPSPAIRFAERAEGVKGPKR